MKKNKDLLIVAAAGFSVRMGREVSKPFLQCRGRSLLEWALLSFGHVHSIRQAIVMLPQNVEELVLPKMPFPVLFAPGDKTRQESVFEGLKRALSFSPRPTWVWVHDAARPLLSRTLLRRMEKARQESPRAHGIIPVIPVVDALKRIVDQKMKSIRSAALSRAQTPQLFRYETLLQAHHWGGEEGWRASDDAELLEKAGISVETVPGEHSNMKVTFPEDLKWVRQQLAKRESTT